MKKELYSRNWDYTLYEVNGKQIITVTIFGRVDYQRSFYLENEVKESEYENLKELSEDIRNNYDKFKSLEITPPILE
ncbi:hypothetical protein [Winogradskyella sp. SYSU M77433]|uniref:hypothetical protein n=1 Tax=Winogradskyella sp. SYSU M77433 TaxID=3042722 RepID=UPI0024813116|nr:hypothetical protein [Winogradskyella sp. SYSU M77433]MDH7913762.1 hypothetical protein [Winogradskyella sp. SYSU M77433]